MPVLNGFCSELTTIQTVLPFSWETSIGPPGDWNGCCSLSWATSCCAAATPGFAAADAGADPLGATEAGRDAATEATGVAACVAAGLGVAAELPHAATIIAAMTRTTSPSSC